MLKEPEDQEYFGPFVTLPLVRRAIHVGNLTFHDGSEVEQHLLEDVMKSIKPWLGVLMENYRVRPEGKIILYCVKLLTWFLIAAYLVNCVCVCVCFKLNACI